MNTPNIDKLNLLKKDSININYKMTRKNFTDKISIKGCHYIVSLDFEAFREICGGKICIRDKIYTPQQYYNTVRRHCKRWISMREDGKDYIEIKQKYKFAKGDKAGRIWVDGFGIQSLQHDIRKILTGDYYYDVDIKNCHYSILLCMIQEYNKQFPDDEIPHKNIKNYCLNRDAILKKYKDGVTKHKLLVFLNIDKLHDVFPNNEIDGFQCENVLHPFIKKIHAEKQEAFTTFLENEDYMKKYGDVKSDSEHNQISGRVNKLFCINENNIIQEAMKEEHTHLVPMFDGFMIDKSYKDIYTYELIDCCPEGCNINWDYKSNVCEDENFINFEYSNDNKMQYEMMEKIMSKVEGDCSIDGEVADIVIDWLYAICGEDIIYYDNLIYNYDNGIYKKGIAEKGNYELKLLLNKYIIPYIYDQYMLENKGLKSIDSNEDIKKWRVQKNRVEKWKMLYGFISSCKTIQQLLGNYISMSKYKQSQFYNELDSNPALIAFDNCVYDLYAGEFRSIQKEDRISITTGYIWDDPSADLMKEFEEQFINKIFVDKEIRKHFLLSLCSCLDGTKRRHKFTIWTNSGRNGKTIMQQMLGKMLGSYAGTMTSSVLQNVKSEAGAANPQFIVLKMCRAVNVNEPEANKKMNSNLLKEITGGDPLQMRRLYASEIETFIPKASICMICNTIPNMDKSDAAIMNRLDLIPFESFFGLRPDGSIIKETNIEKKEFISDNDIQSKLIKWRCCFFKMIVHYFKEYMMNPNFTITTELGTEYKVAQDIVQEFIDEKLSIIEGRKISIKDFCHHLNKYAKDTVYTSRTLGKYLRNNKYDITKQSGESYVMGYNFNWLNDSFNGHCMIDEDEIDN